MTAPARRRSRQTARDMILSLTVILVIVGIVVAFQQRGGQRVRVIDPSDTYAGARASASYPVRVPHLPGAWRPTSATNQTAEGGRLTLRLGFLTPQGQYAQLVESDLQRNVILGRELSPGARPTGTLLVNGVSWDRLPAKKHGDRAIARTDGGDAHSAEAVRHRIRAVIGA
ncbi:MAG: hypothetical protein DLM59_16740, partial [Pseudonocardiales bacterium]